MNVKALIASPSPRDVTVVLDAHKEIREQFNVPFLYAKYWHEIEAYTIIQRYFLEHKEYNFLVIAPDDLIVLPEHYEKLVKTLETNGEDYPVLSGIANLNMAYINTMNICVDWLPNVTTRRPPRRYIWADLNRLPENKIIQVKFSGFPFMFIRRDIVEQIPLQGDTPYDPLRRGQKPTSFDTAFCWEAAQRGIPIHVDTGVKLVHLKNMSTDPKIASQVDDIRTRKSRPRVYLVDGDGREEDYTDFYMELVQELNMYDLAIYHKRYWKH